MNSQLLKNKHFVIVGGIIIALVLVFFVFFGFGGDDVSGELSVDLTFSDPVEEILGRQILSSLNKVKGIKMDSDFLADQTFQSLQDFTVTIPKQNAGRRDPFAVIDIKK